MLNSAVVKLAEGLGESTILCSCNFVTRFCFYEAVVITACDL